MMRSGKEFNYASDSDNFDIHLKANPWIPTQSLLCFIHIQRYEDLVIWTLTWQESHRFFCLPIDTRSASLLDPFVTPLANYSVSHWAGVPENYLTDTPMNMSPRHLQKRRALSKRSESDFNLSASQQSRQMSLPLDKHCKVSLGNYWDLINRVN